MRQQASLEMFQRMSWHPAMATQVARVGRSGGREAFLKKEQSHVESDIHFRPD